MLVEKKSLFLVQPPRAQHWLSKELSTVPSFALQSTYLMVILKGLKRKKRACENPEAGFEGISWVFFFFH